MMARHVDFLAFLQDPAHRSILDRFSRHALPEGRILSEAPPYDQDGVLVVLSGSLRIYLSYEGREFSLFFLQPGDLFSTHSGAIMAAWKPSEILFASLADFEEIIVTFPQLAISCISLTGRVLGNAMQIIEGVALRDVRYRLAHLLIEMAETKGRPHAEGIAIDSDFNTEDIAMMIGATRQSVSQLLNDMIKSGHVEKMARGTLLIRHIDRLREMTR